MPVRVYALTGLYRIVVADFYTVEQLRAQRARWIAVAPPQAGVRTSRGAAFARLLKHALLLDFFLPCVWLLLFTLLASLRRQENRIAILCSSPPFSSAVVSAFVRAVKHRSVYLALDMRDLWSLHAAMKGPKFHKRAIEKFVMKQADIVTTVSVGLSRRFESAFKRKTTIAYNVATHIPTAVKIPKGTFHWNQLVSGAVSGSIKILYTGSLPEGYYDLRSFAKACALLTDSDAAIGQKIQFVFVGACGSLQRASEEFPIADGLLLFAGQHSHENVRLAQKSADALLFLGFDSPDNQGQVSIKLFEYFRAERPILALSIKPASDIDILIERYCGQTIRLSSPEEMCRAFSSLSKAGTAGLPRPVNLHVDEELLRSYDDVVTSIVHELAIQ